jgi:hypothetical protein
MNKILLFIIIFFIFFLGLGCKNEMKYVLFDDTEKLQGYVIFEKKKSENLYYFDLARNKVCEIPSANTRTKDGFPVYYNFYQDGNNNLMVKYINENESKYLQFIELKFYDNLEQTLIDTKKLDSIPIGVYKSYLHQTRELYYDYYGDYDGLINIDTFKTRKIYTSNLYHIPRPVDFFDNKYLALGFLGIYFYDKDEIENIHNNYKNPFIEGYFSKYSDILKKVLYENEKNNTKTIAIFDVISKQTIDTGIIPLTFKQIDWLSKASPVYICYFFGDNYILYAQYKKKPSKLTRFLNPPIEYMIYDYINKRNIGYIENCQINFQINCIYDFFP